MHPVGKVLALYLSPVNTNQEKHPSSIEVDTNGIIGDKHYQKNTERSVLITSTHSYQLTKNKEIHLPFGSLGENILTDFNPYSLSKGRVLHIGEVILEISQHCTLCQHLSAIHPTLPKLLRNDRGIFTKVKKGGVIYEGDTILLVE